MDLIIAGLEIFIAVGFIGFWIYFFIFENNKPNQREGYLEFERSFPLADLGWAVPCLIISAIGFIVNNTIGEIFAIAGGSSLIFLGLLDISHNIQYEGYKGEKIDITLNLVVNLFCIIFGPIFMIYGWVNI
jgi:heme/copper-type cytochrome/quinol oxidase subunit 2